MLSCTFFGYREILRPGIPEKLDEAVSALPARENEIVFLVGAEGEFDALAE